MEQKESRDKVKRRNLREMERGKENKVREETELKGNFVFFFFGGEFDIHAPF